MVNKPNYIEIINQYEEFSFVKQKEESVLFEYKNGKDFTLFHFNLDYDYNEQMPFIFANNFEEDFPHVLLESIQYENIDYKYICLYEKEEYVFSDLSELEKVHFLLNRLQSLLSLNGNEREREFQKEFLNYWNSQVTTNFMPHTFISCNEEFLILDYYLNKGSYRVLSKDKILNDISKWKKTKELGLLIPITDKRGIIPPTKQKGWTNETILSILKNCQENKISPETYQALKKTVIKKKKVDLYFTMAFEDERSLLFGCSLFFKNSGAKLFFDKIADDVEKVEPFIVYREDYTYLNQCIGNNTVEKKVAVVGCGSLGSYVANELVKSGVKNLALVDDDIYSNENTFRHTLLHFWKRFNKAEALKHTLESVHPEIFVESFTQRINKNNVESFIVDYNIDVLIFCIGSTDQQVAISKILHTNKCDCTVLYSWLEGDGKESHTLAIPKNAKGCYQCLKQELKEIFPTIELNEHENWIHDGCGGTRSKYGNRLLLIATNGVLECFEKALRRDYTFAISSGIVRGLNDSKLAGSGCEYCGEKDKKI
ncbi:ThiF family adenylyltransferase [Enterococcus raffinosus]|uniref:ThiF family adenylyltransferase n=1 Tax=Enterococcus raffinosus TaxID=71452 RepID=UPI001C124B08|nr:ThiF family adenylyltransferase [Enterococcus raffinosus]MBU5363017.1 ThiF family adenylyltransferase [Enterococcus raffinosus]